MDDCTDFTLIIKKRGGGSYLLHLLLERIVGKRAIPSNFYQCENIFNVLKEENRNKKCYKMLVFKIFECSHIIFHACILINKLVLQSTYL